MTPPIVLKLGGRALDADGALAELAADLAALARPAIVVHGGGAEASAWCERLGLTPRFEDGLRVTDPPTLEVVSAVLAGLANKRLVAALRVRGVNAVGLAALDGGTIDVRPHPAAARLGEVGELAAVDPTLLQTLLVRGYVPVLASVGAHEGRLLNLNADDLAAALAPAVSAPALILLSDVAGVKLGGAVAARLDRAGLDRALASPDVTGGMIAKLAAARRALEAGVTRVHIAAWQGAGTLAAILSGSGAGTTLSSTHSGAGTTPAAEPIAAGDPR